MSIERFSQSLSAASTHPDKLEKLVILYETTLPGVYDGKLDALFNPTQLDYKRDVRWEVSTPLGASDGGQRYVFEFQASQPWQLTLDLFFDTSEGAPASSGFDATSILAFDDATPGLPSGADVTAHTDKLVELTRVAPKLLRPPCCQLWWGRSLRLTGVLTHLDQSFTWFLPNGTPVRASLRCTFQEVPTESQLRSREQAPANAQKQRVLRRGDTLQSVSAEEYGDPSLWRPLARANGIEDPRRLTPGQLLLLPRLSR